ncbi:MAG: PaaI family thioesterase [Nitrososphaerota archaeon]
MSAGDEIAHDAEGETSKEEALDPRLNDLSPYQGCFACGRRNSQGLQLTFWAEGDEIVTEFTPDAHYQGFPGVLHGGILATLLDETLSRTASIEGRWMMTGRLEIRYRRPAPLGPRLRVTARKLSSRSRMVHAEGEVRLADDPDVILADARGMFLRVPQEYQQEAAARFPGAGEFFNL